MEIIDQHKFEDIAASFHDGEGSSSAKNASEDSDFKASARIYNLRSKVSQLAQLSHVEDAWKKIEIRLQDKKPFRKASRAVFIRYAAFFLGLVALTGITGKIIFRSLPSVKDKKHTEIISSVGETREVLLPDGTTVWLGANSQLQYDQNFGKGNRDVYFCGEALFHVKKDETIPFSVYLGDDASIVVHGTKFLVNNFSYADSKSIILLEGKVNYQREKRSFTMAPGDRITDNRLTKDISFDLVEVGHYSDWINGKVYLDNYKLSDLIFLMEQWYKVRFSFSQSTLKAYRFTGFINKKESLDYNLDIIAFTNKVKFQKNEYQVIIEEIE